MWGRWKAEIRSRRLHCCPADCALAKQRSVGVGVDIANETVAYSPAMPSEISPISLLGEGVREAALLLRLSPLLLRGERATTRLQSIPLEGAKLADGLSPAHPCTNGRKKNVARVGRPTGESGEGDFVGHRTGADFGAAFGAFRTVSLPAI